MLSEAKQRWLLLRQPEETPEIVRFAQDDNYAFARWWLDPTLAIQGEC
jgi:hypothetical protein